MDYFFLSQTLLFRACEEDEIKSMLSCLGAYSRSYERGEAVLHAGEPTTVMGLVLSGAVLIECTDLWGSNSVLSRAEAGQVFAEAYACCAGEPLMVSVTSCERSEILFLNTSRLLNVCPNSCEHHRRLVRNLLGLLARKNLQLSRRIMHSSPKTLRGRLLSYLSEQAKQNGSRSFTIPFNRKQLADYLGCDRSALSNELSKMQEEGLLRRNRNEFTLTT